MDLQLKAKRAIVTGGSRGIGLQVARVLIEEGAHVALAARDRDQLKVAAGELGERALPLRCDTAEDESVSQMVAIAAERFGGIDILVNCAAKPGGQSKPSGYEEITTHALLNELNVKVMGYLRCIQKVVPHMQSGSRIVNLGGLAARSTGSVVGSIRNAGVAAMTKNLADELGVAGISVVVVHPSVVQTEKTPDVVKAQSETSGLSTSEIWDRMAQRNVLNRIIDAAEVASVVAFLCSPKASCINGDAVVVGGGSPGVIYY